MKIRLGFLSLAILGGASIAVAAAPQSAADLTVDISPPVAVYVGDPGQYAVLVRNIGNKQADGIMLTLALPPTHSSPVVHVLGDLGAYDSRCALSGTNLSCGLGSLRKGASTTVRFTIALPQSSAPLLVGAHVSTGSAERSTLNNHDTDIAALLHPLTPISAGQTAHNEHCTGTGLTSFFECELYPSSISSHDIEFLGGGLIAFVGPPSVSYSGTWNQSLGNHRLVLEYYMGTSHEATFDGYAVGNDCFQGVTVFYPSSPYVAPYNVCVH